MALFLIDSHILIAYLRHRADSISAVEGLLGEGHDLGISPVSMVEVMAGALPHELDDSRAFLDGIPLVPPGREIAYRAASLMREERGRGRTLSLPDAVIAATALHHQATLLTYNVRHYQLPGLQLQSP